MKACKDCKWCEYDAGSITFSKCQRTSGPRLVVKDKSYITGEVTKGPQFIYCDSERNCGPLDALLFGACGKKGKYWEAK